MVTLWIYTVWWLSVSHLRTLTSCRLSWIPPLLYHPATGVLFLFFYLHCRSQRQVRGGHGRGWGSARAEERKPAAREGETQPGDPAPQAQDGQVELWMSSLNWSVRTCPQCQQNHKIVQNLWKPADDPQVSPRLLHLVHSCNMLNISANAAEECNRRMQQSALPQHQFLLLHWASSASGWWTTICPMGSSKMEQFFLSKTTTIDAVFVGLIFYILYIT